MTVAATTRKAGPYHGNDATTSFGFAFKVFSKNDIAVTKLVVATGSETTLVLDSDYSVALNADQDNNPGGSVTYPLSGSPLATGQDLTISSIVAESQTTDITNQGGFFPQVIEDAIDRVTILVQQLIEKLARSIKFPVSDSASINTTLPAAAQRASKFLAFDASGNTMVSTGSGTPASTYMATVLDDASAEVARHTLGVVGQVQTITALRAIATTYLQNGDVITVLGNSSETDGGGGVYYWDASSTAADNGGDTILPTGYAGTGRWRFLSHGHSSNQNFTQNGAIIHRLADRIFVGGAVANDGAFPNVGKDWLTSFQNTLLTKGTLTPLAGTGLSTATFSINNDNAGNACAGLFGVQSLHFSSAGTSALGVFGIGVNNNASLATNAWGGYFEAHRQNATVGGARGVEIDVRSLAPLEIKPNPWQQSQTSALQLAAGCGLDATGQTNVGAAIQILDNPMAFRTGIMIGNNAIEGTDGTSGGGVAISLAAFHTIEWYNSAQQLVGRITADNTNSANKTELRFNQLGVQFLGDSGQALGYVNNVANAVNYIALTPAITGAMPAVSAAGADANIDLRLLPKGTGLIKFGTAATAAAVPANFTAASYIPIKDSSGTTYYVPCRTATW